jgi:hypothetical protein
MLSWLTGKVNPSDSIAQKTEMYLRLAAAGTTRTDLEEELFYALRDGHIELAQAITKLGKQDFSKCLVALAKFTYEDRYGVRYSVSKDVLYTDEENKHKEQANLFHPLAYFVIKKNYKALDFLIAHGEPLYNFGRGHSFYDSRTPIACALQDPQMLEYLLKYGAKPTDQEVAQAITDQAPLKSVELLLSYGGSQKVAQSGLATLTGQKDFSVDYAAQLAQLLKLPVAEKSVLPAPKPPELKTKIIEAPPAAAPSPDEVVIESPFKGNRILSKVFNFNSFECIYTIGKGSTAPIETMQVKQFSELQHNSDLRTAFEEHKKRGGTRTEEEIFGMSAPKMTWKSVNIPPE